MDDELRNKIRGFVQWYEDLYGNSIYLRDFDLNKFQINYKKMMDSKKVSDSGKELSLLQKYKIEIEHCPKCPLHKTRTKFVFGVGNEHAEIMFIGEAPGRDEDLKGEPFVGRAGKLLNQMLSQVKLRREDVYIANILKCRPPGNRDPQPDEVDKCIPYLHHQIELIRPKILVALGRVAAQNLLNTNMPLGKMRNQIFDYKGIPLIVTYHPAAILRNMNLMTTALDDFRFILQQTQKSTQS